MKKRIKNFIAYSLAASLIFGTFMANVDASIIETTDKTSTTQDIVKDRSIVIGITKFSPDKAISAMSAAIAGAHDFAYMGRNEVPMYMYDNGIWLKFDTSNKATVLNFNKEADNKEITDMLNNGIYYVDNVEKTVSITYNLPTGAEIVAVGEDEPRTSEIKYENSTITMPATIKKIEIVKDGEKLAGFDVNPSASEDVERKIAKEVFFKKDASDAGIKVMEIAGDEYIMPQENPEKEGHSFAGWDLPTDGIVGDENEVLAKWQVNKYSVIFDADNGSGTQIMTEDYDTVVEFPKNPVRDGYTFQGWFEDGSDTPVDTENYKMPAAPTGTNLKAGWVINEYTIEFDSKGGEAVESITADYESAVVLPTDLTKIGHSFTGWYSDEDCTESYSQTTMPLNGAKLYAGWDVNQYNITFDTDGGSDVENIRDNFGTSITLPSDIAKEGYTFQGWFEGESDSQSDLSSIPDRDVELHAKWKANKYTVKYDANVDSDSKYPVENVMDESHFEYDREDTLNENNLTRDGYTFQGWSSSADGSAEYSDAAEVKNLTSDEEVTLFAIWEPNTYTVKYSAGVEDDAVDKVEGEVKDTTFKVGEVPSLAENSFKRKTYEFMGWSYEMNGSVIEPDVEFPKDAEGKVSEDITLYAVWKQSETETVYTAEYYLEGETDGTYEKNEKNSGVSVGLKKGTLENYVGFNHYHLSKIVVDGNDIRISDEVELDDEGKSVIEYYFDRDTYTVIFDAGHDGFINPGEKTAKYGSTYILPSISNASENGKAGNTAVWKLDGERYGVEGESKTFTESFTLYLDWDVNLHTIKFATDSEDTQDTTRENAEFGSDVEFPADPTKTGYTFAGWFIEGDDTAKTSLTVPDEDVTLTAHWTINSHKITFATDSEDTQDTTRENAEFGSDVEFPADPTKTGYTFAGWFIEGDDTAKTSLTVPDEDVTLTAHWTINSHKITFATDSEDTQNTTRENVEFGSDVEFPTNPTKTGYTFAGWFIEGDDTAKTSLTVPDEDVTLTAHWTINSHKITFATDSEDTQDTTRENVEFGSDVEFPANPTKTGYTFAGWFIEGDDTAKTSLTVPDEDVTLTAHWDVNKYKISFVTNGDEGSEVAEIEKDFGTILTEFEPNVPKKTGYTFAGWYKDAELTEEFEFDGATMPAENLTLYGKWEINKHKITFATDSEDTQDTTRENAEFGSDVEFPADPIKTGYIFAGWFIEGDDTAKTSLTVPDEDVTLTAHWTINSHDVTFATDSEDTQDTTREDVEFGSDVEFPANPTKTGYIFAGWFIEGDDTAKTSLTVPDEDVTLTAHWTPITYKVTFYAGGEAVSPTTAEEADFAAVKYDEEKSIASISDIVKNKKAGYTLKGWAYRENSQTPDIRLDGSIKNLTTENGDVVTLYAVWEQN